MKGNILSYDLTTAAGLIAGEDGRRYPFNGAEIQGNIVHNLANRLVDFQIDGQGHATGIYLIAGSGQPGDKNKIVAGLLALFLGGFGIHKFYLGYTTQGIIMAVLWVFGFILLFVPTLVIGVIALVEAIIYLTKTDDEFHETYELGRRPWF